MALLGIIELGASIREMAASRAWSGILQVPLRPGALFVI